MELDCVTVGKGIWREENRETGICSKIWKQKTERRQEVVELSVGRVCRIKVVRTKVRLDSVLSVGERRVREENRETEVCVVRYENRRQKEDKK